MKLSPIILIILLVDCNVNKNTTEINVLVKDAAVKNLANPDLFTPVKISSCFIFLIFFFFDFFFKIGETNVTKYTHMTQPNNPSKKIKAVRVEILRAGVFMLYSYISDIVDIKKIWKDSSISLM